MVSSTTTTSENIHKMDTSQRASWITRKLVVHKDHLPSRDVISRPDLKKRLLSELESFIPDEESSSAAAAQQSKKRKLSYNELVDERFKQHLKQLSTMLSPNDGTSTSNTLTTTTITQEAESSDDEQEEEEEETDKNNNENDQDESMESAESTTSVEAAVAVASDQKVDKKGQVLKPIVKTKKSMVESDAARSFPNHLIFLRHNGKTTRFIKRSKLGAFPFGKLKLCVDGQALNTIENTYPIKERERDYRAPDLDKEKNSIQVNIPLFMNQYVKGETAQSLFNYSDDASRLTSCEKCLLELGKYYYLNFILESVDSFDIKAMWSQLHQVLLQGGMSQISIPHLNMQFIFFIFYCHVKNESVVSTDSSVGLDSYSNIVLDCSRIILADMVRQELQRDDSGADSSFFAFSLGLTDSYGEILARYLTSSELKNMLVACYDLFILTSNPILLHMSFRLVTLVQKVFQNESQLEDAIITCVNLIDLYSSIDVNIQFSNVFEQRIMQKFGNGLMADALYSLLTNKSLTQGIQNMEFFRAKNNHLRYEFFSERDHKLYCLFRHIVDLISADPAKLVLFMPTICRVLYDDIRDTITAVSDAKLSGGVANAVLAKRVTQINNPATILLIQKSQTYAMLMLCHAIGQGVTKFMDMNKEEQDLIQSARVFHVLLLKNVFNFMAEKGFNYIDEVVELYIDEVILDGFLEPLAQVQPSELSNNILWPQTLMLLSSVIRVDHQPFFKRFDSFWLLLMGICSSVLTTAEFTTLNHTLSVVFGILFSHRFALTAAGQYFVALDRFIEHCENIEEDFAYSMAWYPPIRKYLKETIMSLPTTQIVEYFELVIRNVRSRIELVDVLQKPQILELLLYPLTSFAFNVGINESNFHTLQTLAKKIDVELVAPLMQYGLSQIKDKKEDGIFTVALKTHYALTVLTKRSREFSSDVYTYKPVVIDEKIEKEDMFIDFRVEGSSNPIPGYRLSNIGGMKLKEFFKHISFASRSIICYLLFERVSLFYQQIMIMRHNYLQTTEEKDQNDKDILKFLEYNLQKYFVFLKDEFTKNAKKHANPTEVWNGEVDLVTNNDTYVVMLWFLITNNLTQFIQFLEADDLRTILDFMITQLTNVTEDQDVAPKGHTLYTITKRVWGSSLLEWVDYEKPRETFFELFRDLLEKNIKYLHKDKRVSSLLKQIKNYRTFDEKKVLDKYAKKGKAIAKVEIPLLAAVKIRKAMDKVVKKSGNKKYKKSSILQGSSAELSSSKATFKYLPLVLQLPCDCANSYFDEKQNFTLLAMAVAADLVSTVYNVDASSVSLKSIISAMMDLPMKQKHTGLLFNKSLFTIQMQAQPDEETIQMQTKLFAARLSPYVPEQTDIEEVLQLVLSKSKLDDEQQKEQRMVLVTNLFQKVIEYGEANYLLKSNTFSATHSMKSAKRGLFYDANLCSPSFLDYETHWLTQLHKQTGCVDLNLSDLQANHISQVILLCIQLADLHSLKTFNLDLWAFLLYQCRVQLAKFLSQSQRNVEISEYVETFITNILQASIICSKCADDDSLVHMKRPLADFLEPSFSALLSLLQSKYESGADINQSIFSRSLGAATASQKTFLIKLILRNLQSVSSGQVYVESKAAIISANIAVLRQIFENTKDSQITAMFESTVLNIFNDLIMVSRSQRGSVVEHDFDWIVPMIDFITEISSQMDVQKEQFLFDVICSVVDVLHDICLTCQASDSPPPLAVANNLWTIFDTLCDILQRLIAKSLIQKGQTVALIGLVKKILVILLEQQFMKLWDSSDLDYYLQGVQVACDKVKVLYNTLEECKIAEFMDQIVFDVVKLVTLYSSTLPADSVSEANTDLVLVARRRTLNWFQSVGTEVEGTLVTLFHKGFNPLVKLHVPKRLRDDPASMKIFAHLCNRNQTSKK